MILTLQSTCEHWGLYFPETHRDDHVHRWIQSLPANDLVGLSLLTLPTLSLLLRYSPPNAVSVRSVFTILLPGCHSDSCLNLVCRDPAEGQRLKHASVTRTNASQFSSFPSPLPLFFLSTPQIDLATIINPLLTNMQTPSQELPHRRDVSDI